MCVCVYINIYIYTHTHTHTHIHTHTHTHTLYPTLCVCVTLQASLDHTFQLECASCLVNLRAKPTWCFFSFYTLNAHLTQAEHTKRTPPKNAKRSTPTQHPTTPWSSLLRQRPRQCSTLLLTQQGWGNYQELSCSLSPHCLCVCATSQACLDHTFQLKRASCLVNPRAEPSLCCICF